MLPRIATIESSLSSFQYKLLNNILYLNERLFKFDVKSLLCSLCSLVNETVVHLFCECKETIRIWKHFKAWTNGYMNLPRMNPENMLLGICQERSHDSVLKNHLLLMFKGYIYLNKDNKNGLSISGLKAFIKSIENTEQYIAQERDKSECHRKECNPMLPLL